MCVVKGLALTRQEREIHMSIGILDPPTSEAFTVPVPVSVPSPGPTLSNADSLRAKTTPIKLSFTWFGQTKAISDEHKERMAQAVSAKSKSIGGHKKLFEKHEKMKALTSVKGAIKRLFENYTLPFPEDGIRLIRRDRLTEFRTQYDVLKQDLWEATQDLDTVHDEIIEISRQELGELFNPSDYPASFLGRFEAEITFPNVKAPDYLAEIDPALYEAEKQRITAQFDQAVRDTEQMFLEQASKLVDHLIERLTPDPVTKDVKTFKAQGKGATIDNLNEFFERFKMLNIGSNDKIDELMSQAKQIVNGVDPKSLRTSAELRNDLTSKLSSVRDRMDSMLLKKPKRKIQLDSLPLVQDPEEQTESPSE